MIQFTVEDRTGIQQDIEIPEGIGLSLMEVLKASEYNILATCGGMALCATCHVEILDGGESLPPPSVMPNWIFWTPCLPPLPPAG
jgi:2Fe-2S ferredoxin